MKLTGPEFPHRIMWQVRQRETALNVGRSVPVNRPLVSWTASEIEALLAG